MVRWLVLALVLSVNDVQSHLMICLIFVFLFCVGFSMPPDVSALVLVEVSSSLDPLSPFVSQVF